jgi:hypothetical protein
MAQVKSMLHIHSVFSTHIAELAFAVRSIQNHNFNPSTEFQVPKTSNIVYIDPIVHPALAFLAQEFERTSSKPLSSTT